jgi:hypothetical protein
MQRDIPRNRISKHTLALASTAPTTIGAANAKEMVKIAANAMTTIHAPWILVMFSMGPVSSLQRLVQAMAICVRMNIVIVAYLAHSLPALIAKPHLKIAVMEMLVLMTSAIPHQVVLTRFITAMMAIPALWIPATQSLDALLHKGIAQTMINALPIPAPMGAKT